MKYWRGYLVAAILAAFTWGLMQFAQAHTALVDMIYPYVTRMVQSFLADWSSGVSFCIWQLVVLVLVGALLASIVLMILLRWNPIQWLGWVLATASCLYMLHTGIYGLNFYAGSLAEDVRLGVADYTVTELVRATEYYQEKANTLARQVSRDADGNLQFSSFEELAEQAGEGFRVLTYEESLAVFAGSTVPVKALGWSDLFSSMAITGFTMPLTGEAAVNPQTPAVNLPFTMCHEMAHRMSIATEQDANFAAFLTCQANSSVEFQYSAYFMAYRYCYSSLASSSMSTARAAAARLKVSCDAYLQQDLTAYNEALRSKQDQKATQVATTVNNTYLTTSGDEKGTASYGAVTDLLVSWHIQKIVLPQYVEEEEPFDPMDPSQVDLTGIVNAKPQQ